MVRARLSPTSEDFNAQGPGSAHRLRGGLWLAKLTWGEVFKPYDRGSAVRASEVTKFLQIDFADQFFARAGVDLAGAHQATQFVALGGETGETQLAFDVVETA